MTKYKILALIGEAGSGKDFFQNILLDTEWGHKHFNRVVSWTTRPPRSNEIEGKDYYFVKPEEFFKKYMQNGFIEYTNFNGWFYGTPYSNLEKNKINLLVLNPKGIENLFYMEDIDIKVIYLYTSPKERLLRQLNRESSPDCKEICRRFIADEKNFKNLRFSYHVVINENNEIQPVVEEILDIARNM